MNYTVRVVPRDEFDDWIDEQRARADDESAGGGG
jgi:heme/copper-type cytochrome/quinol oxidase subunit 2